MAVEVGAPDQRVRVSLNNNFLVLNGGAGGRIARIHVVSAAGGTLDVYDSPAVFAAFRVWQKAINTGESYELQVPLRQGLTLRMLGAACELEVTYS